MTAPPPDPGLVASLRGLDRDGRLLFAMRTLRMFGYGFLAVVLVLYLAAAGLDPLAVGLVLTFTLIGDTIISLWLTTNADRLGRRRVLVAGAVLMIVAGVVFAFTSWVPLLIIAGAIGVVSPTGNEVGPFLAIEQAALTQTVPDTRRTSTFAWYNVAGYVATATGALGAGLVSQALIDGGALAARRVSRDRHRLRVIGLLLIVGFWRLDTAIEAPPATVSTDGIRRRFGLGRSKGVVLKLSVLFSIDAFGGGFIPQSLMAYWFHIQFGADPGQLGLIFFAANLLAAVSSLSGGPDRGRFGLINTMVFTHIPSNVLLIFVPLMPTLPLAVLVLLVRFSLSQMDVPTRQSYVMAVVDPDERSAAAGVTGVARTTGAAISPSFSSVLMASAGYASLPFYLAGGFKILYDLLMYREFRNVKPPEETPRLGCRVACAARVAGITCVTAASARTPRRSHPPPDEEQDRDDHRDRDQQVERLERLPDLFPVRAQDRARVDQQARPDERAGGREDDERRDPHPGHAGREADEGPDDRDEPPDEHGRGAMAGEERVGQLDLVLADEQVLAIALEERPATVRPDGVGDERPERVPDGRHDDHDPEVPGLPGDRLDLTGVRDQEPGVRQDQLARGAGSWPTRWPSRA